MAKKIPKKVNKAIRDYISLLKKDIPVEGVFIFGSYAKGKAKKDSDIDIAVISNKFGKDLHNDGRYLMRKLWEVSGPPISPIGYSPKNFETNSPSPLLAEIRKYGKEIKV